MLNTNPYRAAGTFDDISYVEREADEQLLNAIEANSRYPYLLAPRQSGKSSLIAHTANKLDVTYFDIVFIDISTFSPDSLESYDTFLSQFITEISSSLKLSNKISSNKLNTVLGSIASHSTKRIVIFIDEIDGLLEAKFKDNFFGSIRSFFNKRARNKELKQIQFVLSGAAQPTQLISKEHISPFNIGIPIILRDLSLESVIEMVKHLDNGRWKIEPKISAEIYKHTRGSVYLTQLTLEKIWELAITQVRRLRLNKPSFFKKITGILFPRYRLTVAINVNMVNEVIEQIINESPTNMHFLNMYSNIINKPNILSSFRNMVAGHQIDKLDSDELKMLGITTGEGVYRNLIYECVFGANCPLSLYRTTKPKYDSKIGEKLPHEQENTQLFSSEIGELPNDFVPRSNKLYEVLGKLLTKDEANTIENQDEREAIATTLRLSFELLNQENYTRYSQLAIFPENVEIPLYIVQRLWQLSQFKTQKMCEQFANLSLLLDFNLVKKSIRLHEIILEYLRAKHSRDLVQTHNQLLGSYRLKKWADLPTHDWYMWDYLAYHSFQAQRHEELLETIKDLRYVAVKMQLKGTVAVESDLLKAREIAGNDQQLQILHKNLSASSHILSRCPNLEDVINTLYIRLQHEEQLENIVQALEPELSHPYFTTWQGRSTLPDLPHPLLVRTLVGHTAPIRACAVSRDGKRIVSASKDETVRIWDSKTGKELLVIEGHKGEVFGCAFSPDGTKIVSCSFVDNTVRVWDAETGTNRWTREHKRVWDCAVTPDSKWVVSVSTFGKLKVWDIKNGEEKLTRVYKGKHEVYSCAITPDGNEVILPSTEAKSLTKVDLQTGKKHKLVENDMGIEACAVSPDGQWIVASDSEGKLKVWEMATGNLKMELKGHKNSVLGCAISHNGKWIVSASHDKTLKIWDSDTGNEQQNLKAHADEVWDCAISPNDEWLVSASVDGTLKIWEARLEKVEEPSERKRREQQRQKVAWLALSPNKEYLVKALKDENILVVQDVETEKEKAKLEGHRDKLMSCAVSPDSRYILSSSMDHTLKLWDAQTGKELSPLKGHKKGLNHCAFSPDGKKIVSASDDDTLIIWDIQNPKKPKVLEVLKGHGRAVACCIFTPDGNQIVSASDDGTLKIWEVKTGEVLFSFEVHNEPIWHCQVSPDGNTIVSASVDKTLRVLELKTGEVRAVLRGHSDAVRCSAINPRGNLVLSASYDKSLKVWDIVTGECLTTFFADNRLRVCEWFDDEHIIAGGLSGTYFLKYQAS
jgi:WD40 repeat protein